MKSHKNNLKAFWVICPILLMLLVSVTQTQGYQLFFLPNQDFNSNIDDWWTGFENNSSTPVTPGTVSWSSANGGSAHMTVNGAPCLVALISQTNTIILPGDTIIARVTHSDLSNFGNVTMTIAGPSDHGFFGQSSTMSSTAAGTHDIKLVANRIYEPGNMFEIHLIVWPGSGEAWIQYIHLNRAGALGVFEESHGFIPSPIRGSCSATLKSRHF